MVTVDTISYATGQSALGRVLVARSISGVCAILIGAHDNELVTDLAARFPEAKLVPDEADVQADLAKVTRFVDKPTEGLDLPLDLRGTPFQRRVWEALRAIPVGTTVTTASSQIRSERQTRSVPSPAPALPIRSRSPFRAIGSSVATVT
jgi:AraC family transcriptional regulator, regulatory protein of adaptative response / methylated-DNA-[protein]-cysteine methyltransferase